MKPKQLLLVLLLIGLIISCEDKKEEETPLTLNNNAYVVSNGVHDITPAPFPVLDIPGFNFPEDSQTLNQWISDSKVDEIYNHGWGIWAGLTSFSSQKIDGDPNNLRVYETWMSPMEMIASIKSNEQRNIPINRSNRTNLNVPHQHIHFGLSKKAQKEFKEKIKVKTPPQKNTIGMGVNNINIFESVAYSPAASKYAIENEVFLAKTLYDYATKDGYAEIPYFPKNAITIKPVFKVLPVSSGETKFDIAAWSGTTEKLEAYTEGQWGTYVTVDTDMNSVSDGKIRSVNDFIHYRMNKEDIAYFKKEWTENKGNVFSAQEGDVVILVGMHVGTREITNWTWQTFWWDAHASNPPLPSSKRIADLRPDVLEGAARNYAMAVAYYMVNPNENTQTPPIKGAPNYAFNPYLEAGFGSSTFNQEMSVLHTDSKSIDTYVGVRTNCMSCHRMASVSPDSFVNKVFSKTPYVGDTFISKNDTIFKNQLLLDFAWSVQGNIDTTGIAEYIKKQNEK